MIGEIRHGDRGNGRFVAALGPDRSIVVNAGRAGCREPAASPAVDRFAAICEAAKVARPRSSLLDHGLQFVERLALMSARGATGHGGQMAPGRFQAVLAMALTQQDARPIQDRRRDPPVDQTNVHGEPALGRPADLV